MGQSITQNEATELHPDAHGVLRVATEFALRGFDLLTQLQADITDGLIVLTLIHDQLKMPRRKGGSVRELSRKLGMPAETVRRHVQELVKSGQCTSDGRTVAIPAAVLRGRRITTYLRKIYVNMVRLLTDLTRINVASFAPTSRGIAPSGRLTKEQAAIAVAATGFLLAALHFVRSLWGHDVMKGLIFTAIWAANVKHVTNSALVAHPTVLDDSHRLPVSVLAISQSLRLPYETVRRHADALVRDGVCVRVGRLGLTVPSSFHSRITSATARSHYLVMECLAEMRRAGVKV